MVHSIPIRNIYYFLAYAWDCLEESRIVEVSRTDFKEIADLMAHVLINGMKHLLRHGLDRGYRETIEETICLRGRIDLDASIRRYLLPRARAVCRFDDFDHDILHNRILKTTIHRLSNVENLDPKHRYELKKIHRCLRHVSEITLDRLVFRKVQLHRNNSFYAFLMNLCELIEESILPEDEEGKSRFRDFFRDETRMPKLFELFIFNFYRREQGRYRVTREIIDWDARSDDPEALWMLPQMRTDVTLRSPDRTVVIEIKYKQKSLQEYYGKESFHSSNMYQLFSYMKNLEARGGKDSVAAGILLYPTVSKSFSHKYTIQGHDIHVRTIDLDREWKEIHRDMLTMVGEAA